MANEKKSSKKVVNVKEINKAKSIDAVNITHNPVESNEIISKFLNYIKDYDVLMEFYRSINEKMIIDGSIKIPTRKVVKFKHATYYKDGGFELDTDLAAALNLVDYKRYNVISILVNTIKIINKLGKKIISTGYRYFRLFIKSYLANKDIDYTYLKSSFHIFKYVRNYDRATKVDSLRIIVLPYYDTDEQTDVYYRNTLIKNIFGKTNEEFIQKLNTIYNTFYSLK